MHLLVSIRISAFCLLCLPVIQVGRTPLSLLQLLLLTLPEEETTALQRITYKNHLFLSFVLHASKSLACISSDLFCILSTKENLNFLGYLLALLVTISVCFANCLAFIITCKSSFAIINPRLIQRLKRKRYKLGEHR